MFVNYLNPITKSVNVKVKKKGVMKVGFVYVLSVRVCLCW